MIDFIRGLFRSVGVDDVVAVVPNIMDRLDAAETDGTELLTVAGKKQRDADALAAEAALSRNKGNRKLNAVKKFRRITK